MITRERLKELIKYNPESGTFTWIALTSSRSRVLIDSIAGNHNQDGYRVIKISGVSYLASRLAWFYMTGEWPKEEIDHKNTIRDDNRWMNLREATDAINSQNKRSARKDNISGLLGVTRRTYGFQARIGLCGKSHFLGTFKTPELAHFAYLEAKKKFHQGFDS